MTKLRIITQDVGEFSIDFGEGADLRNLAKAMFHAGGAWVGQDRTVFVPWHRILQIEIVE